MKIKTKTSELFCASPASTAICTTMVRRGTTTTSTPRPLNHHHSNHYQFDFKDKPKIKSLQIPCTSSQQHIDPKPYRKSTSKNNNNMLERRKSSAELNDKKTSGGSSSRYLLKDHIFVEDSDDDVFNIGAWSDDHHHDVLPLIKKSSSLRLTSRGGNSSGLVEARSPSLCLHAKAESTDMNSLRSCSSNQVVDLRVSIHCKGCESKLRKHISRMEGVKSFHIDMESKKVTLIGDITPLSVLASISKVKNAQLWPTPPSSSSPFIAIGY